MHQHRLHAQRACSRHVRTPQVANVQRMLGSNSQALEGALEDTGIGLGGTDLVREGEYLEAFEEAHQERSLVGRHFGIEVAEPDDSEFHWSVCWTGGTMVESRTRLGAGVSQRDTTKLSCPGGLPVDSGQLQMRCVSLLARQMLEKLG